MVLGKGHRRAGQQQPVHAGLQSLPAFPSLSLLSVLSRSISYGDNYMPSPGGPSSESADGWVVLGDGLYASAPGKVQFLLLTSSQGEGAPLGWLPTSEEPHGVGPGHAGLRGPPHRSAAFTSDPDGQRDPVRASQVSASQSKRNW